MSGKVADEESPPSSDASEAAITITRCGMRTSDQSPSGSIPPQPSESLSQSAERARSASASRLPDPKQILRRQDQVGGEVRELCQALKRHKAQTARWGTAFKEASDAVKELGDVENYFQVLGGELRSLTAMLQAAADRQAAQRSQPGRPA